MTPFRVTKIWHEVRVPAGTNMSNLNDIDCRIEPGSLPEFEGQKVADVLQARVKP